MNIKYLNYILYSELNVNTSIYINWLLIILIFSFFKRKYNIIKRKDVIHIFKFLFLLTNHIQHQKYISA